MIQPEEKRSLVSLYEDRYAEMGEDVRTLGWKSREDQRLRFQVLCDIGDLSGRRVCDVGCGFGDLHDYLRTRFGEVRYSGLDLSPSLVARARERHPGVAFRVQDILEEPPERADYFLLSGALNYRFSDNMQLTRDMLAVMFERADEGVAVNFLTSYVNFQQPHNFHHSPEAVFALARTLTRWVSLRHDYPLWEFTVYLYRGPRAAEGQP
jgi:SAM-dependent methyltransferase